MPPGGGAAVVIPGGGVVALAAAFPGVLLAAGTAAVLAGAGRGGVVDGPAVGLRPAKSVFSVISSLWVAPGGMPGGDALADHSARAHARCCAGVGYDLNLQSKGCMCCLYVVRAQCLGNVVALGMGARFVWWAFLSRCRGRPSFCGGCCRRFLVQRPARVVEKRRSIGTAPPHTATHTKTEGQGPAALHFSSVDGSKPAGGVGVPFAGIDSRPAV